MKRTIVVLVMSLTAGVSIGTAWARHDGTMHKGVYRQVDGVKFFPNKVVIRCPGWAEDVGSRLFLVEIRGDGLPGTNGDVYVYRCNLDV